MLSSFKIFKPRSLKFDSTLIYSKIRSVADGGPSGTTVNKGKIKTNKTEYERTITEFTVRQSMFRFTSPVFFRRKLWQFPIKAFSTKSKCYYEILGVSPTATNVEIKEAFLKLSKKFHPDVASDSNAHQNFVEINEAYSVLSRSSSRKDYDLRRGLSRDPGHPFRTTASGHSHEMYKQWYDSFNSRRRRAWTPRDDFGPDNVPSNDSMLRTILILTGLVGIALAFQAFILSRNQERQHQKLLAERRSWAVEMEQKAEKKEKKAKESEEEEEEREKKDSEDAKKE